MHYLDGQRLLIWHARKKKIHFGDAIASIQSGIYVARHHQLSSIQLAVANGHGNAQFMRSLLEYFDNGDLHVDIVVSHKPNDEKYKVSHEMKKMGIPLPSGLCFYDAEYGYTKIKRSGEIKDKICYCWDAIYKHRYIPKNIALLNEALKEEFPSFTQVKLGLPMTIEEDLLELSDAKVYIGFDSGVAHLARLLRVPILLLGKVDAFPAHVSERRILKWKNDDGVWINRKEIIDEINDYLVDMYVHI